MVSKRNTGHDFSMFTMFVFVHLRNFQDDAPHHPAIRRQWESHPLCFATAESFVALRRLDPRGVALDLGDQRPMTTLESAGSRKRSVKLPASALGQCRNRTRLGVNIKPQPPPGFSIWQPAYLIHARSSPTRGMHAPFVFTGAVHPQPNSMPCVKRPMGCRPSPRRTRTVLIDMAFW